MKYNLYDVNGKSRPLKDISKDLDSKFLNDINVDNDTIKALESHESEFQQVGENYIDRLIDGMQSK